MNELKPEFYKSTSLDYFDNGADVIRLKAEAGPGIVVALWTNTPFKDEAIRRLTRPDSQEKELREAMYIGYDVGFADATQREVPLGKAQAFAAFLKSGSTPEGQPPPRG